MAKKKSSEVPSPCEALGAKVAALQGTVEMLKLRLIAVESHLKSLDSVVAEVSSKKKSPWWKRFV